MTELDILKQQADELGINYHPSIGIDKLKDKINEAMEPKEEAESKPEPVKETVEQRRARLNSEARALKRVRITCMNPSKKSFSGEFFTVSNKIVGTIKRYVPFDTEEGWHVEAMLLKMIKNRKFQTFVTVTRNGRKIRQGKLVPEFAVEELPALTKKQLDELARRQAMAHTVDD